MSRAIDTRRIGINWLALGVVALVAVLGGAIWMLLNQQPSGGASMTQQLGGGIWRLQTLNGQLAITGSDVSLEFSDGRIGGSSGVNRMFGSFSASDDGAVQFSAIGATRRAGPPDLMRQEQTLFETLQSATRFTIDGNILTISGPNGDAVFVR